MNYGDLPQPKAGVRRTVYRKSFVRAKRCHSGICMQIAGPHCFPNRRICHSEMPQQSRISAHMVILNSKSPNFPLLPWRYARLWPPDYVHPGFCCCSYSPPRDRSWSSSLVSCHEKFLSQSMCRPCSYLTGSLLKNSVGDLRIVSLYVEQVTRTLRILQDRSSLLLL